MLLPALFAFQNRQSIILFSPEVAGNIIGFVLRYTRLLSGPLEGNGCSDNTGPCKPAQAGFLWQQNKHPAVTETGELQEGHRLA